MYCIELDDVCRYGEPPPVPFRPFFRAKRIVGMPGAMTHPLVNTFPSRSRMRHSPSNENRLSINRQD